MELLTLLSFCGILVFCLAFDLSILLALFIGLLIFCTYTKAKGFSWIQLRGMLLSGIQTARNVLFVFLLIGSITALWRSSGTIAVIICYAMDFIRADTFLLMTFLLNCGVSFLTGTSFGTSATVGVICMTMANAMGFNPLFTGGAILAGAFFGDRGSPVSTSALLVSEVTHTDIYTNVKRMMRTAIIPFTLACIVYLALGFLSPHQDASLDLYALFGKEFRLHWIALLPAASILILAAMRVNTKTTLSVSILFAGLITIFLQKTPVTETIGFLFTGFHAKNPEIAVMLNGGGILSMLEVATIVCIACSYAGIFQQTDLLTHIKSYIVKLSEKITAFGSVLCSSVAIGMFTCNQTLSIMLTYHLCRDIEPDDQTIAIDLENTAVVTSALIPWSIAGAVPLATVGAPTTSMLFACYLYFLPLWHLLLALLRKNRSAKKTAAGPQQ